MASRNTDTLRDYPTTRDVSFDEEVAARPAARVAGGEMSLAELKERQRRIAEDFDRRAARP
ncbi:MAG TPA: hypothetical protein P5234_15970 [Thermoanaerobaculaceae bacterium]|jgi:hypothetical protein|nr:hypothetical protein [Thermoanaerobaculaceae bacterium]